MELFKQLNNLIEQFIEEPDAFETQSQREMERDWEIENDKLHKEQDKKAKQEFFRKRNIELNIVYNKLKYWKFIRDLNIIEDTNDRRYRYLHFWLPEWRINWLNKLDLKILKRKMYKSSEGYNVYIE